MSLKERLMQERNDARQEKVRLEDDSVSEWLSLISYPLHSSL